MHVMFAEWERPKLRRILSDPSAGVVVREHRDWLAGFGVERDMIEVLTSMCARLYGHRGARNWPCAVTAAGHEGVGTGGKVRSSGRLDGAGLPVRT